MFDKIVESVLNEISAEDAYRKFYSALPEKDYFNLVKLYCGNKNKFDNILKTVLNSVRDGICDIETASDFINRYKSINDNNIRVEFNNRFNNGEYEDILDMSEGLNELERTGVVTLKQIQEIGLINVCSNEKWNVTCTTTYAANHHYFGKTSWCTASDRLGRYDGWDYFRRYIFQEPNSPVKYLDKDPSSVCAFLVQFTSKENKDIMYQAQINDEGTYLLICDAKDTGILVGEFINLIINDDDLMSRLFDETPNLISLTAQSYAQERPYQLSKNEYIDKKRKAIEARFDREFDACCGRINEINARKIEFVKRKFDELYETNLLTNIDFLNEVIKLSYDISASYNDDTDKFDVDYDEYEQKLNSLHYAYLAGDAVFNEENPNILCFKLRAASGKIKEVSTENRWPCIVDDFTSEPYAPHTDGHLLNQTVCIIAKIENFNRDMAGFYFTVKEIIYIKKEHGVNLNITSVVNLFSRSCDVEMQYLQQLKSKLNIYVLRDSKNDITYLTNGFKEIKLDFKESYCIVSDNLIALRGSRSNYFYCCDYQLNEIGLFGCAYSTSSAHILLFNKNGAYILTLSNGNIRKINYIVKETPMQFLYYSRVGCIIIKYGDYDNKDVIYSLAKNKVIFEEDFISPTNLSINPGIILCADGENNRYKVYINDGEINKYTK